MTALPPPPALARGPLGWLTRLVRGRAVVRGEPAWDAFAGPGWEGRVMAADVRDRFHAKQGRSIARWTLTRPGGERLVVYLKRHYVLPRWRGLLAALCPGRGWSPGLEEWENLTWARANGLPVPNTPAVAEWLGPWGRLSGFLAVEELPGMIGLHEAVPLAHRSLTADAFAAWKRGLTAEVARLSRELHRRRAFHKDLYFCHFYIPEADCHAVPLQWQGRVWMIDFHRLGRHPLLWAWYLAKDLAQLWYSSDVPGVTARDRARFWKLYRAGDWGGATRPPAWLIPLVRQRWRNYEQARRRRAARKATTG